MKEIERHMPRNDEHTYYIQSISRALQKIISINPFPPVSVILLFFIISCVYRMPNVKI